MLFKSSRVATISLPNKRLPGWEEGGLVGGWGEHAAQTPGIAWGEPRFGSHAYQPQGHFCACAWQCNNKNQDTAKISSSYGISHVSHGALKEEKADNGDQHCSPITAARGRKDQKTKGIVNTNPGLTTLAWDTQREAGEREVGTRVSPTQLGGRKQICSGLTSTI